MKDNLARCLDSIAVSEAGFSNHPSDPGGPTNHGITLRTLAAWRTAPVTVEDVRALTEAEARQILAAQYASPIHFDDLPLGLDYCVLDCSVNSGPNRAARILQDALGMTGTEVDGIIGLHTLTVLGSHGTAIDIDLLIHRYCAGRLAFMQALSTWGTFGKGWTARVERVRTEAATMATGVESVSPKPIPVLPIATDDAGQAKAGGAVKVTATRSGKAALANVAATAAAAIVAVGGVASQASSVLQPYGDVKVIHYTLLGLAVVSASGTLVVALQRAKGGATS